MGSSESSQSEIQAQHLPKSPIILKLRDYIYLNPSNNTTSSFISQGLSNEFRKEYGEINRDKNPFCPMEIAEGRFSGGDEWMTCCLISPIMAIACPRVICDQDNEYYRKAKIVGIGKQKQLVERNVNFAVIIEDFNVALLMLEKPLIELGWAGLTYLSKQGQVQEQSFRVLNHPKRIPMGQENPGVYIYRQEVIKALYSHQSGYFGSHKTIVGSLVLKIIDRKPYVVGVQVNENQCRFFDDKIFQKINKAAKKLIKENKDREKEIFSQIDFEDLELMGKL